MWLASFVQFLAMAAAEFQPAVPPPPPTTPGAPAPVYSRQTLFAIPFRIDRADRITSEPVEVQLYVSGDRGGHWDLYRKTAPTRGQFLFRAGMDGEYWFSVRTLDRSGKVRPEGPYVPELKVIVDTRSAGSRPATPQGSGSVTSFPPADPNPIRTSPDRPAATPDATAFLGPQPRTADTQVPAAARLPGATRAPGEAWSGTVLGWAGRITSCQQGLGSDANKLTITWEVDDNARLAPRPITLCLSETLGGPWTTIASGLENTGRYTWTCQDRLPPRVFLRLEIRDEAGNISPYETREPVALGGR
jgi:hypothetical protein